jgi:hypothetical protein
MERRIKWAFAVPLLALFAAASAYAADGPDTLWEITVKMDMPGMPMAMPPQKTQVCVKKDDQQKTVPMDKNCQMLDFQRSGLKTTYSFKCTGEMEMTGKGQVTYTADQNSYQGSMQAKGSGRGSGSFEMSQNYTGKRLGNCTHDPDAGKKQVAAMQAKNQQTVDQLCTPKGDGGSTSWQMYEPGQVCASYRDAYCKRAKALAGEMAEPAKFTQMKSPVHNDMREGMRRCGVDVAAIQPAACKQANSKRNWKFVADNCDADAKAIAAKECAGRDFTSAMSSQYAPICRAYAKGKRQVVDAEDTGDAPARSEYKKPATGKQKAVDADDEPFKKEDKKESGSLLDAGGNALKGGLKSIFGR